MTQPSRPGWSPRCGLPAAPSRAGVPQAHVVAGASPLGPCSKFSHSEGFGTMVSRMILSNAVAVMCDNYEPRPLARPKGAGALVTDEPAEYLECSAHFAVNALGHAHPAIAHRRVPEIRNAGARLQTSYVAERRWRWPRSCCWRWPDAPGPGAFRQPGAEANEGAFKLLRLTDRDQRGGNRGGFHDAPWARWRDRTGKPSRIRAGPLCRRGHRHIPYGDGDARAGGRR